MESKQVQQIDLRAIFNAKVPKLMKRMPDWLFRKIQRLLHEDDINVILARCGHLQGVDFVQVHIYLIKISNAVSIKRNAKLNAENLPI